MSVRRVFLIGSMGLWVATALVAGTQPLAVSPGSLTGEVIADRCPTFSWGEVEGATGYELVVYRVAEGGAKAQPVLRQEFAGSVYAWTPPLDRCLERGYHFAWLIRSDRDGKVSPWSEAYLFSVAGGRSAVGFADSHATSCKPESSSSEGAAPGRERRGEPILKVEAEDSSQTVLLQGPSTEQTFLRPADSATIPPPAGDDLWVGGDVFVGGNIYLPGYTYWRETVSAMGFLLSSEREEDEWERSTAGFGYIRSPQTGDLDIYLVAPVDVPKEGQPLDVQCHIYDNSESADANVSFQLHRRFMESHWTYASASDTTSGASTDLIPVYGTIWGLPDERNPDEYWWLEVHWEPGAAGSLLRFYGCSVRLGMNVLRF